jgi:glycerol-3-phosphate acyltransferase PlsY
MTDWPSISLLTGVLAVVLGYLSGSIPFGLLLTRWAGLGDVRSIGSGNIGATNVLRTGSKKIAAATLLCDALKGTVPVLLMKYFGNESAGLIAGIAAFVGHLFPVWLGFRGGKGVATFIGVLFGISWPIGLIFLVLWLGLAFIFKISSVSALTSSAAMPLVAWGLGLPTLVIPLAILAAIIWWTHRANIGRLLAGTEPKINLSSKA